ncbi:MAG: universal stress protein [Halobacteriales archaeon]
MYDNILIATDGSEIAKIAAEHGIELAKATGATVHALYVVETQAHYILTVGLGDEDMAEYREYGEDVVENVVEVASDTGIDGVGVVKSGGVADEIVEYAEEHDVDLIVMGATGRSAVDKYLIGSTAEKVVRTAECPVLTIRE